MQRRQTSHGRPEEDKPRTPPAPGKITDLTSQARDPERVNLFINNEFAMGLARTVVENQSLTIGLELTQEMLDTLLAEETYHRSLNAALHFLSYRPRSEGELRQRLRRSDASDEVIERVIAQLRDWRYVDDEDFAQRWIENRQLHRPRGSRLLVQELRAKGVESSIVHLAIEEAEIDEEAQALTVARKRFQQLVNLDPKVRERRVIGLLQRRGFGFDSIRKALVALGQEEEEATEIQDEVD